MLYQTDTRLKLEERDDECYLFCILRIYEKLTGAVLTPEQISLIHKLLVRLDYIRMDGFVQEKGVQGIAQVASGIVGKHAYIKRVSNIDKFNFLIACWGRKDKNDKMLTHFVEMKVNDPTVVEWDPYSPAGSKTVREGKILSYRYIFGEKI